jgi:hypothetical protein
MIGGYQRSIRHHQAALSATRAEARIGRDAHPLLGDALEGAVIKLMLSV